jgi:hypothetical protein
VNVLAQLIAFPASANDDTRVMTVPHATMMAGNHMEGRIFFKTKFDGGSKAQYVKKNAVRHCNPFSCVIAQV